MLYMSRKDGERGLIAIEYCVELSVSGMEVNVHGSEEILIQGARGNRVNGKKQSKEREEIIRLEGESFT